MLLMPRILMLIFRVLLQLHNEQGEQVSDTTKPH